MNAGIWCEVVNKLVDIIIEKYIFASVKGLFSNAAVP